MSEVAQCPLCSREMRFNARYPRAVCHFCRERATDVNGRPLELFQAATDGRYAARYSDNGEAYPSHECYIDGVRCWADEARFGGIVLQTA